MPQQCSPEQRHTWNGGGIVEVLEKGGITNTRRLLITSQPPRSNIGVADPLSETHIKKVGMFRLYRPWARIGTESLKLGLETILVPPPPPCPPSQQHQHREEKTEGCLDEP